MIMISFYCIQENLIEHHIFRTIDMEELPSILNHYSHSKFLAYFKVDKSVKFHQYEENLLIVLSEEYDQMGNMYIVHFFNIEADLLVWIGKQSINTKGKRLRSKNPIVKLRNTHWHLFVEESQKMLFFVSDDENSDDYILNTKLEVNKAYS